MSIESLGGDQQGLDKWGEREIWGVIFLQRKAGLSLEQVKEDP